MAANMLAFSFGSKAREHPWRPRVVPWRMDPLSTLQRSKIRRVASGPPTDEEATGEVNVVPFLDIITNVLMFVLATLAITFTATIDTKAPRGAVRGAADPKLDLTVVVAPGGFSVKARGGNVAPGCADIGPGIAVPKRDGVFDYEALKACVTRLKGADPAFSGESGVTITASPQIDFQSVIATTDALRTARDGEPLLPDVSFAVVR